MGRGAASPRDMMGGSGRGGVDVAFGQRAAVQDERWCWRGAPMRQGEGLPVVVTIGAAAGQLDAGMVL